MFKVKSTIKKMSVLMDSKQKFISVVSMALNVVTALFECVGVTAIIPLIAVILGKSTIHSNPIIQKVPFFAGMDYIHIVFFLCLMVVGIYILKNSFFIFSNWFQVKFSCKLQREMGIKMLKSYMKCGYQYFLKHDLGYFNRGIGSDVANFYTVLTLSFSLFSDICTSLLVFILLVFTDWQMALSVMVAGTGCLLLMFFVFRRNMREAGDEIRKCDQKISTLQTQTLYGMKDIMTLRRQRYFIEETIKYKLPLQEALIKQAIAVTAPVRVIEAIFISVVIFMIGFKAVTMDDPSIFIARLAAFAMGSFRILPALSRISSSINGISSRLASVESLYETVMESEAYAASHTESDFENPLTEADSKGMDFKDSLVIKDMTFRYRPDLAPVLENLNLTIRRGESVAFIGQSGSGKSTLMDIILGLVTPEQGGVTLDGVDIRTIPQSWSRIVGYIPQMVFLTDDSIRENIAFGIAKDEIDDRRIEQVLEQTALKDFVNTLEQGVDTPVGDRGVRLSGGQRQRIAIARALYHNPQIMVLDEATSALDNETEAAIMDAINNLQGQVTLIIVAHRLTTVRNCDVIYRVEDKKITLCDKKEIFG